MTAVVGETGTYAYDKGYRYVCEMPHEAALAWALSIAPDAKVGRDGGSVRDAVEHPEGASGYHGWFNKTYVVVSSDPVLRETYAVYVEDGKWYLVRKGN